MSGCQAGPGSIATAGSPSWWVARTSAKRQAAAGHCGRCGGTPGMESRCGRRPASDRLLEALVDARRPHRLAGLLARVRIATGGGHRLDADAAVAVLQPGLVRRGLLLLPGLLGLGRSLDRRVLIGHFFLQSFPFPMVET